MGKEKTGFNGLPTSVAASEFKIGQQQDKISIQRINGSNNPAEVIPFNGNPVESQVNKSAVKKTSKFLWLDGNAGFQINSEYQAKDSTAFKATETSTLSNDGKVLAVTG